MCETIVAIVGFLFWILHGLIFYKINQFYPDHTPETEQGSVNLTAQSPKKGALPRHNQEIATVSQPERQSVSLDSYCPPLRKNPENMKSHHSMATDNGMQDYVENLKEELRAIHREILKFPQEFQQLSFILTSLEETKCENDRLKQEVASLRTTELEQEKQRQIAETEQSTIARLQSELEFAKEVADEKILENERLYDQLADLEKLITVVDKQNMGMKMDMKRLKESVSKRKSDWRSSELKLVEINEDLKKKLSGLQTEHQRLLKSNSLVKTELESANKEIKDLREKIAAKEQDTIDFRKEIIEMRAEREDGMVESCKAASLSPQPTTELGEEKQRIPECSARRSSSQSDISQRSSEEMLELETQLRDIDYENQILTSTINAMHQAEKESQKTVKMMEYQLYRNLMKQQRLIRLKGLLMAAQKPVQTAEGQVTVLPERFGALKEIEMEASGVIESEKTDDVGSADLPQKNADFHAITSNEVVTEANGIVEAEKIEEMDSKDPIQKNADINKKKPWFKVKRWLQKRVFRQRKVTTV